MIDKSNGERARQLAELRVGLALLGARIVEDDSRVVVQCPARTRDAVRELLNEHGIVTA